MKLITLKENFLSLYKSIIIHNEIANRNANTGSYAPIIKYALYSPNPLKTNKNNKMQDEYI